MWALHLVLREFGGGREILGKNFSSYGNPTFHIFFLSNFQNGKVDGFRTSDLRIPSLLNIMKDPKSEQNKEHLENNFVLKDLQMCAYYILRATSLGN